VKIDLTRTDVGGFNFEFPRLISSQSVGAAEIGECLATIGRIEDDNYPAGMPRPEMISQTVRYLRAVRGGAELTYFPRDTGASGHCQMGGLAYAHAAIFEWLNRTVTTEPPSYPPARSLAVPDALIAALRRYHPRVSVEQETG